MDEEDEDEPEGNLLSGQRRDPLPPSNDIMESDDEEEEIELAQEALASLVNILGREVVTRKEVRLSRQNSLASRQNSEIEEEEVVLRAKTPTKEEAPEDIFERGRVASLINRMTEQLPAEPLNPTLPSTTHLSQKLDEARNAKDFPEFKDRVLEILDAMNREIEAAKKRNSATSSGPPPVPSGPPTPPPPPPPGLPSNPPKFTQIKIKSSELKSASKGQPAKVKITDKSGDVTQNMMDQLNNTLKKRKNRKSLLAVYSALEK